METIVATTANVTKQDTIKMPDFGNGRYSPLMAEVWHDAQSVFGLNPKQAEKLARNIGTDYGVVQSGGSVTMSKITLGKVDKNARLTVKEAATSIKGVVLTNTLFALKALCWANEAGKNGFNRNTTQFVVCEQLDTYFNTLA